MELFPLIKFQVKKRFKLSWPGADRDWLGLIHATYIYVCLVHYFNRFNHRPIEEQKWAYKRKNHILDGLTKAILLIEENGDDFTSVGKNFFKLLKYNIKELSERNKS